MSFEQIKDLLAVIGFPAVMSILLLLLLQRELRDINRNLHNLRETIQKWLWETERKDRQD